MPTPHKWAKEIKAWADGETIEFRTHPSYPWSNCGSSGPSWLNNYEYRVKPKKKSLAEVAEKGYKSGNWMQKSFEENWTASAKAVIEAYKREELDYD